MSSELLTHLDEDGRVPLFDFRNLSLHGRNRKIEIRDGGVRAARMWVGYSTFFGGGGGGGLSP